MGISEAVSSYYGLLASAYVVSSSGIHAETIIAAAAALTGAQALTATEEHLPPKGWITSEKATLLVLGHDQNDQNCLWATIVKGALDAGLSPSQVPDRLEVDRRTVAAFGSSSYPPISIPQAHYPKEWSPNAVPRFRGDIDRIGTATGIGPIEKAIALALTTASLIRQSSSVLDIEISTRLALEVMVGCTHMVPLSAIPGDDVIHPTARPF